jgi:hypothetical protein
MDFADQGALQTMKWVLGQVPGTPPSSLFLQLHVGDPGSDGTANPAAESERKVVVFDTAVITSNDGSAQANTVADIPWIDVAATEIFTHVSIWDNVTAGACWYKGPLQAPVAVAINSNFTFPAGSSIVQS